MGENLAPEQPKQRADDYTISALQKDIKDIFSALNDIRGQVITLTTTVHIQCPERERRINDNTKAIKSVAEDLTEFIQNHSNKTGQYKLVAAIVSALVSTFFGVGGLITFIVTLRGGR